MTLWENEFFNRSVGAVYDLRGRSMGNLPETKVTRSRGLLIAAGRPITHRYVLTDSSVPLVGAPIAEDVRKGMVLLRADRPLRLYRVSGLYPNDTWSGARVTFVEPDCNGGRLTVGLASDRRLFTRPQTVRAARRSVTFDPASTTQLTVPLRRRRDGTCRVVFHVSPTAVPARVTAGNRDTRVLGSIGSATQILVSTGNLQARIESWLMSGAQAKQSYPSLPDSTSVSHARPNLENAYLPPRSEVERHIVADRDPSRRDT